MRKIELFRVPRDLREMWKWLRYDEGRNHLERYMRKRYLFLRCVIKLNKTWARSYEPKIKRKWIASWRVTMEIIAPLCLTNVWAMVIFAYTLKVVPYYIRYHHGRPSFRSAIVYSWNTIYDQRWGKNSDNFCKSHPSFCMTILVRIQRKLWLVCLLGGLDGIALLSLILYGLKILWCDCKDEGKGSW